MQLKLCSRIILVGQKKRNKSYCKEIFAKKEKNSEHDANNDAIINGAWMAILPSVAKRRYTSDS